MKFDLLEKIRVELWGNLDRLSKAAIEAHAAATDPGSKAEGKYDTRSLEASYLAVGQARQVDELAQAVRIFESLSLPEFDPADPVDAGALVETSLAGETSLFLLVPVAGGMILSHEGLEITLLTPESPLYGKLHGMVVGESMEFPPLTVLAVC